ncbi:hypothetical protein B7486_22245 [cyanobacterium TDX16]|nr:hypothetical protein B7486_22245 [cyanobacterium TDX16]
MWAVSTLQKKMFNRQTKKITLTIFLALLGLGYFGTFSSMEMNPILRSYVILIPVQVGAIAYYFLYLRWKKL